MKYTSCKERAFVDNALEADLFRIDYQYEQVLVSNDARSTYYMYSTFYHLGVTTRNSQRFIVRAIYRDDPTLFYWFCPQSTGTEGIS